MGRKRPIQVFIYGVEPLVIFTLLQPVLILALATPKAPACHERPGEPAVRGRRSLPQPVPKLLRVVIVEVAEADLGIAGELDLLQAVAALRVDQKDLACALGVETVGDHLLPLVHSRALQGLFPVSIG